MSASTYQSERPCRHGHIERYLRDDRCAVCDRARVRSPRDTAARNRQWRKDNLERSRTAQRERYADKREDYLAQKAEYDRNNRDKRSALGAKRRADQLCATPPWLTVWQHLEMKHMYTKARESRMKDGIPKHVDHILPLKGVTAEGFPFCGLHVPWNLQLLENVKNISKGNRIDLDWVILPPYRGPKSGP